MMTTMTVCWSPPAVGKSPGAALAGVTAAIVAFALLSSTAKAATPAERFAVFTKSSTVTVDHKAWSALLTRHVKPGRDGLNRVDYKAWKAADHAALDAYIATLEEIDVATLDRPEQFAFWANLYNAKTIDVVLDAYPVKSIKDISLGGTLLANFTGGPWKAKVVTVGGEKLSLDDIEHGILRPIFKDPRVHYAVNCASVGCPNLDTKAWTGATLEADLDTAARAFATSPRGLVIAADGEVVVSSIYSWFVADFGGDEKGVLAHLARYANENDAQKLKDASEIGDYQYDWSLNDIARN